MLLTDGYLFMWEKRSTSLDSCINRGYTPWAISANLVAISIPAKYYLDKIKIICVSGMLHFSKKTHLMPTSYMSKTTHCTFY